MKPSILILLLCLFQSLHTNEECISSKIKTITVSTNHKVGKWNVEYSQEFKGENIQTASIINAINELKELEKNESAILIRAEYNNQINPYKNLNFVIIQKDGQWVMTDFETQRTDNEGLEKMIDEIISNSTQTDAQQGAQGDFEIGPPAESD